MKPRIAITLGDPAGIGPEIVSKALRHPRVLAACEPIVVGDPLALALHRQPLPKCEMLSVPGLARKLPLGAPSRDAGRSAIDSLRQAVGLVTTHQAKALVTAPVSKESFHMADLSYPGHTEWLAHETSSKEVAMLMVAGELRAVLMTRHVPLAEVSWKLTTNVIMSSAELAFRFAQKRLGKKLPRLVACGMNPHAGDNGLIGLEEKDVFAPTLRRLKRDGIPVKGPFGADSVFRDMASGLYDVAMAAYHDQGMIPLKLFAPERLVNITLGLPFIRTSPGHGTAYDIAGKGKADAEPIIEAICLAAEYSSQRPTNE
jgi:4-hydroxythreonine-4-phosphate dehydrogenase